MVLLIYYVVLTVESREILWSDLSNETSLTVRSHGTIWFSAFLSLATSGSEREDKRAGKCRKVH